MNGIPRLAAISLSLPAVSSAMSLDSTTHGPAMMNSGLSRPTSNPHSLIAASLRPKRNHHAAALRPVMSANPVSKCLPARQLHQRAHDRLRARRRRLVLTIFLCRAQKRREQRMSAARRRSKLGVELATDEPRILRQLDHLAQIFLHGAARDLQAGLDQPRQQFIVDLIAMTMPLVDGFTAVDALRQRAADQPRLLCAESHHADQS